MITQIKLKVTQIVCCFVFCFLSTVYCQGAAEEGFIYDSEGRRDPFVPLLDKESPTGLRITFTPPEVSVELPLEVTVKGILWSGKEYYAIINNEVVKKGQNLGELKIKEIQKNKVIVEYGGKKYEVLLRKEKER